MFLLSSLNSVPGEAGTGGRGTSSGTLSLAKGPSSTLNQREEWTSG